MISVQHVLEICTNKKRNTTAIEATQLKMILYGILASLNDMFLIIFSMKDTMHNYSNNCNIKLHYHNLTYYPKKKQNPLQKFHPKKYIPSHLQTYNSTTRGPPPCRRRRRRRRSSPWRPPPPPGAPSPPAPPVLWRRYHERRQSNLPMGQEEFYENVSLWELYDVVSSSTANWQKFISSMMEVVCFGGW